MHADRQHKRQKTSVSQISDTIDLPYCEGVQVRSFYFVTWLAVRHV